MKKRKIEPFDIINTILILTITVVIAYPLYFCIVASFSDPQAVAAGKTLFGIVGFNLDAYKYVLQEKMLWIGYRNTIVYTVLGTIYNLVLTITAAYVMSKTDMPFYKPLYFFFLITMYFGGGMIPTYLLMKELHLLNNPLALILGPGVSCYNMIIARQYFLTNIPKELYEAARIDGASNIRCYTNIALPLAKPIIAVIALYNAVGHWNSYYSALLYIQKRDYYPLQLVLRNILINNQLDLSNLEAATIEQIEYAIHRANVAMGMKYSIIFIASLPMLILYPFIQKHFTKGIMIGAVKG